MLIEIPQKRADAVPFEVNNRAIFSADILTYQHGRAIEDDDIVIGATSALIRLGRDNDMFMIAAFKEVGDKVHGKLLMSRLRDGKGIDIRLVGDVGGRELYGIRYGRNKDLYNEYGIRHADFEFVFDPSAPRTGTIRNANTIVRNGYPVEVNVLDLGLA